jgi:exopolyphosphatase/guanosine-5'-triphosphate,3'-diphosphate pyrophosphatase
MPGIVPRWEWRSFAASFGAAEEALQPADVHIIESDELYLLSASGVGIVKVRDGLMDVKRLQQVDGHGLEQWVPVLKAAFPLAGDDLVDVTAALGLSADVLSARTSWSLAELLADIVDPRPDLRAVEVHKRRSRSTLDGCMVELTDVTAGGWQTRTAAVEDPDPDRVVEVVDRLGLMPRPNLNYGRGLVVLLGLGHPRCAVIDVGTNSVKFHVAERAEDGSWRTVVDRAEVTRLGDGLTAGGRLAPEAVARTVAAIAGMVDEAGQQRAVAVVAVGTAGLRMAADRDEFTDAVRRRCGVLVETISGEEEARLAARAATAGLAGPGSLVVFDTGGGSSQFTFGHDDQVDEQFSVQVGAVRLTERFGLAGPVSEQVLTEVVDEIGAGFSRLDGRPRPDLLIGMGGALTNLAAVRHGLSDYDPEVVHGTVLDRGEVDRQIDLYRTRDAAGRRRDVAGLQPSRAEVILAGACIVRAVLEKLGADSLTVSDRGLRHGVLVDRFGARRVGAADPPGRAGEVSA